MSALDTNALVRFLVRDDVAQYQRVRKLLEASEEPFYLAQVVLAETTWVLERGYKWAPEDIARALEMLASTDKFSMDEVCAEAVSLYRTVLDAKVGFSDCLILRASKRDLPLHTFDAKLLGLKGTAVP